jgi:hypothetical protein
MVGEREWTWNEAVMFRFEALSLNHEIVRQDSPCVGWNLNRAFPERKLKAPPRDPTSLVLLCIKRYVQKASDVLGVHDEFQPLVVEGVKGELTA